MTLLPVSHQQQREEADCLVVCTAMVLTYLQIPYRYEQLRRVLRTEQHGTIFSNLGHLETIGVWTSLGNGSFVKLQDYLEIGLPVIVAVETEYLTSYWDEATHHAVVVIGIDGDSVYLNDPAFVTAPQIVARDEFEAAWVEHNYRFAVITLERL